jgi:hypothetical protein
MGMDLIHLAQRRVQEGGGCCERGKVSLGSVKVIGQLNDCQFLCFMLLVNAFFLCFRIGNYNDSF